MIRYERLENLQTVLNSYAPNGIVQKKIAQIRSEMERANEDENTIARTLTEILAAGLSWDNWPT